MMHIGTRSHLDDEPVADDVRHRFTVQRIVWDTIRDRGIETHDPWFTSITTDTGVTPIGVRSSEP